MEIATDVYRRLQRKLNKMPVGYPATKTGVEISLLKRIFTEEQAAVAEHLDHNYKTVDQIFDSAGETVESKEELSRILEETVSRGGISRRRRDGEAEYALLPFLLWGMYEHQLKRLNPAFLEDCGEYMMGEFGLEMATSRLPKMRVIPIEESVGGEHRVSTYDELRHLIDKAGNQIAIQECFCRKVADMQGKGCSATDRREVCMSLGDQADLYVEEGWARRITQEEALEIARLNEQEGLVLMPGNAQEPSFMCACCSDCCGMLSLMKNFPKPAEVVGSNYQARVTAAQCTACGACVSRCPLEAITLDGAAAAVDLKRCIGCGLCVPICPEEAIALVKKEKEVLPPATVEEHYETILAKRMTFAGRTRDFAMKALLRLLMRLPKKASK